MNDSLLPPRILRRPGAGYAPEERAFEGIPSIERAANGRLWVAWYAGNKNRPGEGSGNYVILVTSGDEGAAWSAPVLVLQPEGLLRAFDSCLWTDPSGRLWLFWAQSCGFYDGRCGVWGMTTDEAGSADPVWSEPFRICDGIMMNKPTVLRDGSWLLPVAIWAQGPGEDTPPEHRHDGRERTGAWVVASGDAGRTWEWRGRVVTAERACDEHMIVERSDGSLWMTIRVPSGIAEAVSRDQGRSWSEVRASGIRHANSRFFIRRLQSGRLVLVSHHPPPGTDLQADAETARSHLTVSLSEDEGHSWSQGLLMDARQVVSYPDGVEGEAGRLYFVHDRNRTTEREILFSALSESEIAAGQISSGRLCQMVNKTDPTG